MAALGKDGAMSDDAQAIAPDNTPPQPEWWQALDDLERSLREAGQAVALLRRSLEANDQEVRPAGATGSGGRAGAPPPAGAAPAESGAGVSAFDRLWDRIEHEKMGRQEDSAPEPSPLRRGADLLPQQYLMTVEDREGKVDLVPLHRALLSLQGIQDVSLVSYANGVAVISLRTESELDLERLGDVVSRAMDRQCEVIPQDTGRLYLRMMARSD